MEGITEEDKIYAPIIINRRKTIMPDIKTMEEMYYLTNKLYPAVEKINLLSGEELEIAKQKILSYPNYSQREKDYLIFKINGQTEDTTTE